MPEACSLCETPGLRTELVRNHGAVCRHLGLLTPSEIKDIRTRRDMSQAAFAELTGLGEATIARWERGDVTQNRGNDRFLRMVQREEGWRLLLKATWV